MKRITSFLVCLAFFGLTAIGQDIQVSGKVTSADDGSILPGVSVVVKGTTTGTTTNIDGVYTINTPNDAILVFSFMGMKTQELAVGGQTTIDVALMTDVTGLEEVVVTALGIKRSEKAIGYAASTVQAEELTKTRSSDVISSLAGKVAGVDISLNSSSPGASNAVIVRGMSSLSGSNQPLFVVDGVPILNVSNFSSDGLNSAYDFGAGNQMINPDDVASVTVLKGAAASALYGNRASNGVIIITTKEGKKGEGIRVEVNSSVTMSDLLRLPEYQNEFGMGWDGHHTLNENGSWGPRLDGTERLWGTIYNNSQKLKPYVAQEDNVKDFFEYGWKFQNSVSVSGGNDQTTYYASFSHVKDDGIIPQDNDSYEKYTATFNGSHQYKKLKVSTAINFSRQENNFVPTGQGTTVINNISQIPRDISIVGLKDYVNDPFNSIDYYFTPYGVINPYTALDYLNTTYQGQKVFGKMQLDYEIIEGLNATYRLGFDASDNESKQAFPRIVTTPGTPNYGEISEPGYNNKNMVRRLELNHDLFVTYFKEFGDITVNALAGMNIYDYTSSSLATGITNLDIPDFFNMSNSAEAPTANEARYEKRMVGVFANLELAYKDILFLTLTGRQDKTSTLPTDNNTYFYPGTQLSFVFSEFLKDYKNILSFGQVRLAWGKTGKDAAPYQLDPYFVPSVLANPFGNIQFPLSGQNAYEVGNRLANQSLQPEIRTEYEIGTRMDFFTGRLGFDITYYNSVSNEQIFELGLDPATGYTAQTTNLGEISNKGIELMFNVVPVQVGDFKWDVRLNYTKNKGELVSLPEELGDKVSIGGLSSVGFVLQVGQPLGLFEVTVPQTTAEGNIVVGNDGQPVAAAEKAVIPKADFDYTMGIVNTFTYKGLNFSFDFDIRQGGMMFSRTKDINLFTGNLKETLYNNRDPFVIPNSVQAVEDLDGLMDADGSSIEDYIENTTPIDDAGIVSYFSNGREDLDRALLLPRSYVKLKRVTIGYTLPEKWVSNTPLKQVTVSAYGNNLLLWTPEENYLIDPESSTFGNDLNGRFGEFSSNPPTRNYGVNLKLVF